MSGHPARYLRRRGSRGIAADCDHASRPESGSRQARLPACGKRTVSIQAGTTFAPARNHRQSASFGRLILTCRWNSPESSQNEECMKIATFNVNSIRRRIPLVLDWIAEHKPDVMCLQETKVPDQDFPVEAFRAAGYHAT